MAQVASRASPATGTMPGYDAFTITPSDSVDLTHPARAIYVGGGGDISLVTLAGNTVVFTAVPQGTIFPMQAQRINSTNTTASLLKGII